MALGPVFSSQFWSIIWLAMVCASVMKSFGKEWCTIIGKKPSIMEKWANLGFGRVLSCLVDIEASSSARTRPRIVTTRAASLSRGGKVMTGVFVGGMLWIMISPPIMLAHASRLMGLMEAGQFSLMGERVLNRGCPRVTWKTSRRL